MRCPTSGSPTTARAALDELGVDFERIRAPRARSRARQRRPRAACRVLHGEHGHAVAFPRTATASATTTASSARSCATAGSRRCRRSGCRTAIRWEFERPEVTCTVGFGGTVENRRGRRRAARQWHPAETRRRGRVRHADRRLARARTSTRCGCGRRARPTRCRSIDFNRGDHVGALAERVRLEAISRVLYPSDETAAGQDLRLRQEFFFASASLQDLLRRHRAQHGRARLAARSRRDPAQRHASRDRRAGAHAPPGRRARHARGTPAWSIATRVFNYTNHTLLPEALETWPVRAARGPPAAAHADHRAHQRAASRRPARAGRDDGGLLSSVSVIDESARAPRAHGPSRVPRRASRQRRVGAAHRAHARRRCSATCTRSHPDKIVNKTNGITFRRWLFEANPRADLRCSSTRSGRRCWTIPTRCARSRRSPTTPAFRERVRAPAPRQQGARSRALVAERTGVEHRPGRAVRRARSSASTSTSGSSSTSCRRSPLYQAMRADAERGWVPRVKIFAGKAAAGYRQAKLIIKLIHDVARVVNARSRRARPARRRVPAELQREPRGGDHSRGRPVRADLAPRAWRPRAPAT